MTPAHSLSFLLEGHWHVIRWDESERSLFGVFQKVLQLWLAGTITRDEADLIRDLVCAEVQGARA